MDSETRKAIADEAIFLARSLAPCQNELVVLLPGSWWDWIYRWFRRPLYRIIGARPPLELRGRDITRITNALLNAGNALNHLNREQGMEETRAGIQD